jgi:hypothetical protein
MNSDSPRSARRTISSTFSFDPGWAAVGSAASMTAWISSRTDGHGQAVVEQGPIPAGRPAGVGLALERLAAGLVGGAVQPHDRAEVGVAAGHTVEPRR